MIPIDGLENARGRLCRVIYCVQIGIDWYAANTAFCREWIQRNRREVGISLFDLCYIFVHVASSMASQLE